MDLLWIFLRNMIKDMKGNFVVGKYKFLLLQKYNTLFYLKKKFNYYNSKYIMNNNNYSSSFFPITRCNEVLLNYLKLNNLFCKGTGEIMINQELKEKRKFKILNLKLFK